MNNESPNLQNLETLYRLANHRAFRAIQYANSRKQFTILGPGPDPNFFIGYQDGSEEIKTLPKDLDDWVFVVSFL